MKFEYMQFDSKEELEKHISNHMPIAIKPTKPAKTTFVNPFTSNHARKVVQEAIVKCLMKD